MRQGLRTVTADSVEKINGFVVKIKKFGYKSVIMYEMMYEMKPLT